MGLLDSVADILGLIRDVCRSFVMRKSQELQILE